MSDTAPPVPPVAVKCLVWDLDNTLWQGTLLEDEDVVLSEAVREVVAGLDARGVLQSVCSRNDHDLAWARLEALGVADYFVVPEIGWGRKSDAVRRITEQLGFAPGTVAFIDDQPHGAGGGRPPPAGGALLPGGGRGGAARPARVQPGAGDRRRATAEAAVPGRPSGARTSGRGSPARTRTSSARWRW